MSGGGSMQTSDLYDLIAQDGRAHRFFAALPDGVPENAALLRNTTM